MNKNHPKDPNSGCFSATLRLLLCARNVPTYPTDNIHTDSNKPQNFDHPHKNPNPEIKIQAPNKPGLIPRLMGLNSLPETNQIPNRKSPESFSRSKSVNFVDYLLDFDSTQSHHHRRVRTSTSFREVPEILNRKNDLLVVYLKNSGDETEKMGKEKKRFKKKEEIKREKNKISKMRDEPRREKKKCSKVGTCNREKDLCSVLGCYQENPYKNGVNSTLRSEMKTVSKKEEACEGSKLRKKKKNGHADADKKIKPKFERENSGDLRFSDVIRTMETKNSMETFKFSYKYDESAITMEKREREYYNEMVGKLRDLTEEDIRSECNWVVKRCLHFEDFEDICVEFQKLILDLLLLQIFDELV